MRPAGAATLIEPFAEFRCCSRHDQISTFRRTETGLAREIRRRDADMLEMICGICASGTRNTRNAILNTIR